MGTHYYLYNIPDDNANLKQALAEKRLLGIQTLERGKRCFTWQMNPGDFMSELAGYADFLAVIDEYGNKRLVWGWINSLKIDIMRYNRDELLELEDSQAKQSASPPINITAYTKAERICFEGWPDLLQYLSSLSLDARVIRHIDIEPGPGNMITVIFYTSQAPAIFYDSDGRRIDRV